MRGVIRGTYAAGRRRSGGAKFVWAVYALATGYHADETTTPYTGSFTLSSSSRYKMAAKAYTATATTFTLTSPVQTTRANLRVGDYLVNVSSSNNTSTSGSYLYKITSISGNTFRYTRWQPAAYSVRGDTVLNYVESDTADYPMDGVQGGYWYVMVKGEMTMHVWDVFSTEKVAVANGTTTGSYGDGNVNVGSGYTIQNNMFVLTGTRQVYSNKIATNLGSYGCKYILSATIQNSGTSGNTLYEMLTSPTLVGSNYQCTLQIYIVGDAKGSILSDPAESADYTAYPQDGAQDGYWYTYSHSYLYQFDNR